MDDKEVRLVGQTMTCLVTPGWAAHFDDRWLAPAFWAHAAQPVSSGGRGGAWFIADGPRRWVLRHYLRGGLAARLSRDSYLFSGEERTRSFREFRLLQALGRLGLPVPAPVAAGYCRQGRRYSAAILLERLEDVRPLGDLVGQLSPSQWQRVGQVIGRFHRAGVYHADLNCFNVLIRDDQVFLIDFDKGELRQPGSPAQGWQARNLQRLQRSLRKLPESAYTTTLDACWRQLLTGYQGTLTE
ncbi:MAG: 3-deoxy-D-manno-octulosonic acid kinase [Marinobacter sp.]|nr:3-deoxy-D-manno-octulosonic acid kinase [Marinobacter sp.]